MIGGKTSYDGNIARLRLLSVEWNSQRTLAQRLNNLRNGTGPVLEGKGVKLAKGVGGSVPDDGERDERDERDELFGGGDLSWYFTFPADATFDVKSGDARN